MTYFLATLKVSGSPQELAEVIPVERAHIATLHAQGLLPSCYVDPEQQVVWMVLAAGSEPEARQLLDGFPLANWFEVRDLRRVERLTNDQPAVEPG